MTVPGHAFALTRFNTDPPTKFLYLAIDSRLRQNEPCKKNVVRIITEVPVQRGSLAVGMRFFAVRAMFASMTISNRAIFFVGNPRDSRTSTGKTDRWGNDAAGLILNVVLRFSLSGKEYRAQSRADHYRNR